MSIARACRLLGYSKQAWHKGRQNSRRKAGARRRQAGAVLAKVDEIRKEMPRLGVRKLKHLLDAEQIPIGRDRLFDLLRDHDLLVEKRKKRFRTTDSTNWLRQFDNLVEDRAPTKPEETWVADITYFQTEEEGAVYGHFVTDAYSKKVMGHEVAADMKAETCKKALLMGLSKRRYKHGLIHHSDRGMQYCSKTYTEAVEKNSGRVSTTQIGSPYENAVAERLNGILKEEFRLDAKLKNLQEVQQKVDRAVEIYNHKRPHLSCHLLTPEQMHQQQSLPCKTYRKKNKPTTKEPEKTPQ